MLPIKFGGGASRATNVRWRDGNTGRGRCISGAMVYLMHVRAAATIVAARSEACSRGDAQRDRRPGRFWLRLHSVKRARAVISGHQSRVQPATERVLN